MGDPLVHIPTHVEPPVGRLLELLQRRRLDGVDGNPLPRRHDADDAITRPGAAARREAYRQVGVDATDRNGGALVLAARHLELHGFGFSKAEPTGFRVRRTRRGGALLLVVWIHGADHV